MTCTAARQYSDIIKGFFNFLPGETVTLNMGFRVYEDEVSTSPRIHRDYANVQFELREDGINNASSGATHFAMLASSALTSLALFVAALAF